MVITLQIWFDQTRIRRQFPTGKFYIGCPSRSVRGFFAAGAGHFAVKKKLVSVRIGQVRLVRLGQVFFYDELSLRRKILEPAEARLSRHNGGPIEGPLKPLRIGSLEPLRIGSLEPLGIGSLELIGIPIVPRSIGKG